MPVRCYQVGDFTYDAAEQVLSVSTVTMPPSKSNLEDLLRLVAPSVVPLGRVPDLFDLSELYHLARDEARSAVALLQQHSRPNVTPITSCAVSICLDFYQHPEEEGDSVRWVKTPTGSLVHRAKYGGQLKQAGPALAEEALQVVRDHPIICQSRAIAAIPSSQTLGPADRGLTYGVARTIADAMSLPVVPLARVRLTDQPQKALTRDDDADANQAGTMAVEGSWDGMILIVDDLMRHGSTISEAARALRFAGADQTSSLTLVKEYTGTASYF